MDKVVRLINGWMYHERHQGRTLLSDQNWETDVLIVGSGASGAIVADELVRAGREVLILEGSLYPPQSPWSNASHAAHACSVAARAMTAALGIGNTPVINLTMGRCIGGVRR